MCIRDRAYIVSLFHVTIRDEMKVIETMLCGVRGSELVMLCTCSFGLPVTSTEDAVCRHSGVLRTKVADCQFVSVERDHFYRILHQVLH